MAKRLIPMLNRVLVEKIVAPSKTTAGILLPETSSKLNSGKVVAVGPGLRDKQGQHIPVSVKEGETVLLPEYGGTAVKLGEKELDLWITQWAIVCDYRGMEGESGNGFPWTKEPNSTSDLAGCEKGASWAAPLTVAYVRMSPYPSVQPPTCKSHQSVLT
ncbi:hypothetical protein Cgig2_001422 [Carnegiea gigantea]|uniref:Protein groES n=1 Tax=Carnegiea gigantea TaxID=171969 RepID=A0A9Q1KVV7_9CARY|nr:hypothetical protein Cgig2_001422 [Carnegiea gigantea]